MGPDSEKIPFPQTEISTANGDLENMLLKALTEEDAIPSYKNLPSSFTSKGVERYANWLMERTQKDPLKKEQGGALHIKNSTGEFIYSKNPKVGSETTVNPVLTLKRDSFTPAVIVHTHPVPICFSDSDVFNINGTIVELIANPEFNYLLIRTDPEILVADDDKSSLRKEADEHAEFWDRRLAQLRVDMANRLIQRHISLNVSPEEYARDLFDRINQLEEEEFGVNFLSYAHSLLFTYNVAQKFKLGFYYSRKNGLYKKVDKEFIDENLTARYDHIVDRFIEELRNS